MPVTFAVSPLGRAQPERRRLAMSGSLTAGLAHTLTNAVMPALLRVDTLAMSTSHSADVRSQLQGIRESLTQLQSLANGLRLISGDPLALGERETTHLDACWHHLEPLVCAATTAETRVDVEMARGLPAVAVPPGLIAQVLMTLVVNARQCMRETPRPILSISARLHDDDVFLTVRHHATPPARREQPDTLDPLCDKARSEAESESRLRHLRKMLRRYDSDLITDDFAPTGGAYSMRLRVLTRTTEHGVAVRARVWVWLSDPRQAVVARLVLAQQQCVEWTPPHTIGSATDSPAVIVCDLTTLRCIDTAAAWRSAEPGTARIIVIGTPPPDWQPREVRWIDASQLATLSDVLHEECGTHDVPLHAG